MAALMVMFALIIPVLAQVPDLTNGGVPINTRYINLGPTGMEGWMYNSDTHPKTLLGDLNHTGQSRQILVTAVDAGSPAGTAGILVDDVILGATGDGTTPTDFTSDARKSLALAIAAAEARTTPELKLKIWRSGLTSTYTLPLQNLGSYGPNAPVSDAKCDLILENARQALLAENNPGTFALGTLALMALDDPAHPDHAAMKAQIDSGITSIMLSNGELPGSSKPGWQRGHSLIVLAEYYLNYGEHPNGGVLNSIEAYVNDITQGQSIFGTFGHIFAQFRWPDGDTTPMMGGYGAINSSAVPGLYGLMLAKECGINNPALDESINRGLTFYGSYARRGAIPYGEHTPAENEFSTNGKSGAAALALDLAVGKEEESKYFAKMSAASFHEYESGHTGSFFQSWWSPLGAAHAGDDAIKSYFAEISWLYDLARKWDGSFAYNHITTHDNYSGFNSSMPSVMTYALPLKRLHMTGRGRTSAGVLDATERAEAVYSANYDEAARTKAELIADLGDWAGPVHVRAATALAGMSLTPTDMDSLHALASDPLGTSREGALLALEKIRDPSSAPVLSAILSDPDPHIRRLAAKALLLNPAKAGELNTVLAATAAAERPVFPMDPRDPLQHDLADMGKLIFGDDLVPAERGILFYGGSQLNLTGVDRQLLYPAVRAVAGCSVGIGRSTLNKLFAALDQSDIEALGDVLVDTALYRAPADPMFADPARESAINALTAFRYAEAIPVAERSIRGDFTSNANRALYGEMFRDLQQFGGTNRLVEPDPDIDQLCIDYIGAHWDTFGAANNVAEACTLIDVMETDDAVAQPVYLKSFDWIVTDAAELTLPANQTQLHASVTDHAKGDLTYTWRKVYGPGAVVFSDNGTATSKDTTITFDNTPGPYLFEVAVIDARGLSEITGTVAMTLYDSGGSLPSNLPPTADPLPVTVAPLTPSAITLTGSDPEGAPLLFAVTGLPMHGTLSGTAPNLTYVSDASYHNGSDSFTFQVTDSFGQTSSATVSITVDSASLVTHVHESFDYSAGAGLAGNAGGTGMTGSWLDGPDGGLAWIYDETTATTPVNTGHGTLSWDGVVDNLPTHAESGAKYVGLAGATGDKFEVHRALAQDAGTMAGADNVLWASIAYHRDANSFAQHIGFALSSDCFTNQGRALDTSGNHGSGAGNGIGLSRDYDVGNSYAAVVFNGGSPAASTTAPEFASGDFIMVLKFEFGAVDKVSAYAFREADFVSEDSFYSRAVTASAAIDESTLNRITVAAGRGDPAFDEIHIGDSFAAVVGMGESLADVTPPAPDPMTFAVAPAAAGASSITMTATTAADPSGVEYYFACTSGDGNDSGWQDSPTYTDNGLGAGSYAYAVMARDKSPNRNATVASAPEAASIASSAPGEITWEVFDILGNVYEVSTAGTLVQAHAGADLGTGNVVDGTTMTINTVVFDDGFVFDSPSNLDTIGNRAGANTSGDYRTLLQTADRQSSGTATFTFNGLTVGNTYQIQVWHSDNVSAARENGMVLNTGGTVATPTIGSSGHVTVLREVSEGNAGQYAVGTFVANATSQQFLARAYGSLTTSPTGQGNITINAAQLRLIATGSAPDTTPPALAPSNIVDDQGGEPVPAGAVVRYELTFSEEMNPATVNPDDFSNAGTSSVTIGTIVQLSPNVYQVRMTALTAGTLRLQVDAGAALTDSAGNALDTSVAILDDTAISVIPPNSAPAWNLDPVDEVDAAADANYNSSLADDASDANGDPLEFAKVSEAGWLNVAPNGTLSGVPGYGDLGLNVFTISVTDNKSAPVEVTLNITVVDATPPTPSPMTWANVPTADGVSSIIMTATTASDPSGVEYYFAETTGNPGGSDSGWQDSPTYTDGGLDPETTYTYTVTARDKSAGRNQTTASSPASATTDPPPLGSGVITWSVFDSTGALSEISQDGTLVEARSGGLPGEDFLVAGINFVGGQMLDAQSHYDNIGGRLQNTEDTGFTYMLREVARQGSPGLTGITFTGLTVGKLYQIQIWAGDKFAGTAGDHGLVLGDGTGAPLTAANPTVLYEIPPEGNNTHGQYAIGTFVADSGSMTFALQRFANLLTSGSAASNTQVNGIQLRDLGMFVPDTTAPTLASGDIVDDQGGANVEENNPVTYTLTFSEDMDEATVNAADFSNAGTATVTIGSVTESSPGVFSVETTPTSTGTLQLQVSAGAVLNDTAGNPLDTSSAIADNTVIAVDPALVTVPDVVGLPQATAEANIVASQLTVGSTTQGYSPTVPAGDVISQGLTAGSAVPVNSSVDLVVSLGIDPSPKLVRTTVSAVSNTSWTTVSLGNTYNSPVIVATPIYPPGVTVPLATRITNVTPTGFDLKIDRADGLTDPVSIDVSVVVVDEGVYTQAADGVKMEAVKFTSTVTARKGSWVAEARGFQNSYTNPVVVGQVMSANDAAWSVFWSMGSSSSNPVNSSNLNVGKHVGEDPDTTRADETIGYIVIEAGNGTINGIAYEAALGADSVRGFGDSSTPYSYSLSGNLASAASAAASVSGMDGADGSWAVLSGSPALTATAIRLHACEDKLGDSEQNHTHTQVAYIVFE